LKGVAKQLIRYIFIGGFCAIADMVALYALVEYLHIWYLVSATISFTVVSFFGYFGQKYFTFEDASNEHKRQLVIFFLVALVGLAINSASMFTLVSVLGIWYIFSNIITKIVVLFWNFSANKYITFKHEV